MRERAEPEWAGGGVIVRWDDLFRDLEGQFEQAERAELTAEIADRTRRERALIPLAARLRAAIGHPIGLQVLGVGVVRGRLESLGAEWLLLLEAPGRQSLVPLLAVQSVTGLGRDAAPQESLVSARLRLGHVLRALARDRAPVSIVLLDATTVSGTIDAVGADFLELAEHLPGELRRSAEVRGVRCVPFAALAAVRGGS